jgi:hypothetical protein
VQGDLLGVGAWMGLDTVGEIGGQVEKRGPEPFRPRPGGEKAWARRKLSLGRQDDPGSACKGGLGLAPSPPFGSPDPDREP